MSKIGKYVLSIMIIMMCILGINTTKVEALSLSGKKIGSTVRIGYGTYTANGHRNLFCVEKGQRLRSSGATYTVIAKFRIEGKQAWKYITGTEKMTDKEKANLENKTKNKKGTYYNENNSNAKLSYILSKTGTSAQKGIWRYMRTWISNSGKHLESRLNGFATQANLSGSQDILDDAKADVDKLNNVKLEDATNAKKVTTKTDVTVKVAEKDEKSTKKVDKVVTQIGPFKFKFKGDISEIEVFKNQDESKKIKEVYFGQYKGNKIKEVDEDEIDSGEEFYVLIPQDKMNNVKTIRIKATIQKSVKGADIWFLKCSYASWQNLVYKQSDNTEGDVGTITRDQPVVTTGNLKVIKVDKRNGQVTKLGGVGFYIQSVNGENNGKYVKQSNGKITYVSDKNQATKFMTAASGTNKGSFTVKELKVGKYKAIEVSNPDKSYDFVSKEGTVTVDKTAELEIENKAKYVDISGYVWVDKQTGKQSKRNDLYKNDTMDDKDTLLEGVKVELVDNSGNVVKNKNGQTCTATTKDLKTKDGVIRYYKFENVLIEKLKEYKVRFTYDGLTYQCVNANLGADNGSKAFENDRDGFNKKFSYVQGTGETTGETLDQNGKHANNLTYKRENYTSTLINNGLPIGQYPITADTAKAGYSLEEAFKKLKVGETEIKYVNLGLYEREQPYVNVVKDVENVKLSINGKSHVYKYASRKANEGDYTEDDTHKFNVGVKFANERTGKVYERPVYKADYEFDDGITDPAQSKNLQVAIRYKIAVTNNSTNLTSQINSLIDYYDARYTLSKLGDGIDDQTGEIIGDVAKEGEGDYNTSYKKVTIKPNMKIEPGKTKAIYVEFTLNRQAVQTVLADKGEMTLENVTELTSYTTYGTDGKVYAGVDLYSNPGNAVLGDKNTYEADTDSSPALKLKVADNARLLEGKVFVDKAEVGDDLATGKLRIGNGKLDEDEAGVKGVKVTLKENKENGQIYNAETNGDGEFTISGYIPGDYTLTYTWGDKDHTVQNYKGTIYDETRYRANYENSGNTKWYKVDPETRYTDAIDNWTTRQEIDKEMKTIENSTKFTKTTMDSTTPLMDLGVENTESDVTSSDEDIMEYKISNIDFGIVERARQAVGLTKKVKSMKVTLANGSVLANVTVNEEGKLEGDQKAGVIYLPPQKDASGKIISNGMLKLEMDTELMEGAKLEVTYEYKITNKSELDYDSKEFYITGKQKGNVIKITSADIIDYLDPEWDYNIDDNSGWELKDLQEIQKGTTSIELSSEVLNSEGIKNKKIFYTTVKKELEPNKSDSKEFKVSKLLSSSKDISLNNDAEITKVVKNGGSNLITTLGNYVPDSEDHEMDDGHAETVTVTPSTGENRNYLIPAMVIISAFVILGTGIIFIKKKVLNK